MSSLGNLRNTFTLSTAKGASWARSQEEFQARINAQNADWYENFRFDNGSSTRGRSPSSRKLEALMLPRNLEGYSLLDIGAYEGFYSFHMEQRGASVTANDFFVWQDSVSPALAHFNFFREALQSEVVVHEADIDSLSVGGHDIVLFLGVLYHLEDPIGALRHVRKSAKKLVVIETLVDLMDVPGDAVAFYSGSSLNGDSTNVFGPNLAALAGMLARSGFQSWEVRCMWEFNTVNALRGERSLSPLKSGRVVIHATP